MNLAAIDDMNLKLLLLPQAELCFIESGGR